MQNMTRNREQWRMQVERLLATDMTVAEWCKANRKSESSMFKWIGYFADHEPELFGGAQNIEFEFEITPISLTVFTPR